MSDKIFIKNVLIFAGVFLAVFMLSYTILAFFGLVPTEFEKETREDTIASHISESTLEGLGLVPSFEESEEVITPVEKGELPVRIVATSIGLDTAVVRPASANFSLLNNALMKGAVYYPGSGIAGKGNMFVFGHSTSYQYVNNKAYQVFNSIKNLEEGDEVRVYGIDKIYIYKVRVVKLVNAETELVEFGSGANMLTLSTCNSFGQKSDRYVAEADFYGTIDNKS